MRVSAKRSGRVRLVGLARRKARGAKARRVTRTKVVRFARRRAPHGQAETHEAGQADASRLRSDDPAVGSRALAGWRIRLGPWACSTTHQAPAAPGHPPLPPRGSRGTARRPGRPDQRRPLRLPRRDALPLPMAERPLHGPRPDQGKRPALGDRSGVDAGQPLRDAHRRGALQPPGRLQPRQHDRDPGAGARHAGGVHADGRRADHRHRPRLRRGTARGGDQRPHQAAPARLVGDRRQPDGYQGRDADHPPGQELR